MRRPGIVHAPSWLLLWVLCGATHVAAGGPPPATAAEPWKHEPSLEEVRHAALRYAGLDRRPERGWARRSRLAGVLPVLTVSVSRDLGRDADLSRASSGTERLDKGSDEDIRLAAKAVWRLDRLLFDDLELRAARMAQQRHRQRLELLSRITSLYYQRRKLQLARQRGGEQADRSEQALAIDELTDQLDALTGGWFRRRLRTARH